jgi:hypothetical protein
MLYGRREGGREGERERRGRRIEGTGKRYLRRNNY